MAIFQINNDSFSSPTEFQKCLNTTNFNQLHIYLTKITSDFSLDLTELKLSNFSDKRGHMKISLKDCNIDNLNIEVNDKTIHSQPNWRLHITININNSYINNIFELLNPPVLRYEIILGTITACPFLYKAITISPWSKNLSPQKYSYLNKLYIDKHIKTLEDKIISAETNNMIFKSKIASLESRLDKLSALETLLKPENKKLLDLFQA